MLVIASVLLGAFAEEVNTLTLRNHTTCGHVPTGKLEIIDTSQFENTDTTTITEEQKGKNGNFMGSSNSKSDDRTANSSTTSTTPLPSPSAQSDEDKTRHLTSSTIRFSYDYSNLSDLSDY